MVVLDETIVNVALPHIQNALRFSGSNLEWVVNAYALAFGGLLLLGGRSGDLLGRRRVFIAGIVVFSLASLLGGFATSQAWLLAARAVQGAGAVRRAHRLVADCGHLPQGPPRNRAMGVYAAMSVAGGAVGLIAGGLLVNYANWRWVLFVNVPIGLIVALLARRALRESQRRRASSTCPARSPGRWPGRAGLRPVQRGDQPERRVALGRYQGHRLASGCGGAAGGVRGHRGAQQERAGAIPVLRSRDRSGSYLIMLCAGAALFGMFFFLTLFLQNVWGYSALKTGVAYLPMVATIMAGSAVASQLVNRIGARPLLLAGAAVTTGGLFWMSRITEHSHYASGPLGPTVVAGAGLGLIFVPLSLLALAKVADHDAGVASSLLNTGEQVGGSIGLVILGTVAWTAVASSIHSQAAAAARHAPAHLPAAKAAALHKAVTDHALSAGFSKGYLVSAGIAALALIIAVIAIRAGRKDLAEIGTNPMAAPTD